MSYHFATPKEIPLKIQVAVLPEGAAGPEDPASASQAGHLKCLVPEEMRHAFLLAIDRDRGMKRQAMMAEWKRIVLSATVTFIKYDGIGCLCAAAANLREDIGANYETLYPTSIQRVYALVFVKKRMEEAGGRVTSKQLVMAYNTDVKISSGEAVSDTFVDIALQVHEQMLAQVLLRSLVLGARASEVRMMKRLTLNINLR